MTGLIKSTATHQERAQHARSFIAGQNQPPLVDANGHLPGELPVVESMFTKNELRVLKARMEQDHLDFTRYMFKHREGSKFKVSPHHRVMCDVLDQVLAGNIKRLIVNCPPGYTKTELAVIHMIARGFAIQPNSKFIHISYSDALALLNSTKIKDVVLSEEYQQMWPVKLRADTQSKKAWSTSLGGSMMAVSSGGMITGFRAGRMQTGFSGAIIIDDPLKPQDAYSQIQRDKVNNRFTNTFKSRLAHEDIPIIVIMQRLHEDDPSGFLLKGGSGDRWHHLVLPADIPEKPKPYPKEYTHGIPIEHGLGVGPIWPYKHTADQLKTMANADSYTYASQYDQVPSPIGGGLFKESWWKFYDHKVPPLCEYKIITGDTAQKTGNHNDYSCLQCWGFSAGKAYLLDQIHGKWEAPTLKIQAVAFWNKHLGNNISDLGRLRCMYIEDKVSGTGLIQDIKNDPSNPIPVTAVQRNTDKVTRAMDILSYISTGYVVIPRDADFTSAYLSEFSRFTPTMAHRHDDMVDPTIDAINLMLRPPKKIAGAY